LVALLAWQPVRMGGSGSQRGKSIKARHSQTVYPGFSELVPSNEYQGFGNPKTGESMRTNRF